MKKLLAVLLLSVSALFAQHGGGGHAGGGGHFGSSPAPRGEYREYHPQREYHGGWHRFGEPERGPFRPYFGVGVRVFVTPICPPRPFVYIGPPVGFYAPGPNFVWVSGHYDWDGYQYVWVDGQWVMTPFYGAVWVNPVYVGGYFHCGYWRH